jgi:hypothetical protein
MSGAEAPVAGSMRGSIGSSIARGGADGGGMQTVDPDFHLFLLLGQSNMEGIPAPQAADTTLNPNVLVLGYQDCAGPVRRSYNEWGIACPPLHSAGLGLGPGDHFGKAVAQVYPTAKIGLIPCAIAGVDIDFFRKGVVSARRSEFVIPPDDHWAGAYEWVIQRAQLAQRAGVIRGILFHQGESNPGEADWVGKVAEMVADLRADLGLAAVPFLVGELFHGSRGARPHNALIARLPSVVEHAYVVSARGLGSEDDVHFDLRAQRLLGVRYAEQFLAVFAPSATAG